MTIQIAQDQRVDIEHTGLGLFVFILQKYFYFFTYLRPFLM